MLLAEANQWPADVRPYFGDGDECHMAFHFPLMPRMFMAVRQEDRHPIVEILRQTPDIPENCQWAMFLRNHDELTLEMVTDEERDYMYQAYAADPQMRINVGIRRRLAPLLENSRRRIELLNSLLFSMPGTPIIYYGDEIGMGDNIYLGDRNGVRTPMQWTGDRNAGFSRADPARLYAPPIMDPVYGYQAINVEAQERAPFSLLNWMKRMIGLRKQTQVFGRGTIEFLPPQNRKVLAYVRRYKDDEIPVRRQPVALGAAGGARSVARFKGLTPVEMLGLTEFPPIGELPVFPDAARLRFYWFRLQQSPSPITRAVAARRRRSSAKRRRSSWASRGTRCSTATCARSSSAICSCRSCSGSAGSAARRAVARGALRRLGPAAARPQPLFLTIVEVEYEDGDRDRYFLPLAICAADAGADGVEERTPPRGAGPHHRRAQGRALRRLARRSSSRALLEAIERQERSPTRRGVGRTGVQTAHVADRGGPIDAAHPRCRANRATRRIVLRRPPDPEAVPPPRAGHQSRLRDRRQLTERSAIRACPPSPARSSTQDRRRAATIAMLQQLVEEPGRRLAHATDELSRFYDRQGRRAAPAARRRSVRSLADDARPRRRDARCHGRLSRQRETLGRRTAEVHLALAQRRQRSGVSRRSRSRRGRLAAASPARRRSVALETSRPWPRSIGRVAGSRRWSATRGRRCHPSREPLTTHRSARRSSSRPRRSASTATTTSARCSGPKGTSTSSTSRESRRGRSPSAAQKQSPLKDVAGMLRSFSYAAYAGSSRIATRPGEFERLEPWARVWQTWAGAAFLQRLLRDGRTRSFVPAIPSSATCCSSSSCSTRRSTS